MRLSPRSVPLAARVEPDVTREARPLGSDQDEHRARKQRDGEPAHSAILAGRDRG